MDSIRLTGATNSGGAATLTGERTIYGFLYAVEWQDGSFDDGVDAVLTCLNPETAVTYTHCTLTNANDDAFYYPRVQFHDTAAGAALTGQYGMVLLNGTPIITIAQGGNVKTGGATLHFIPF